MIYGDDDPWNQSAAENAEWLMRFKRDAGLSPHESGPGLPTANLSWQVSLGGSGFYPPYINPGKNVKACDTHELEVNLARIDESEKIVKLRGETANGYIKSLKQRYKMPAAVFCSRELEEGLLDLIKTESEQGHIPTDDSLRARARAVLNMPNTAADDGELLSKFKAHYGVLSTNPKQDSSPHSQPQTYQPQAQPISSFSTQQPPAFLNDDDLLASFDEQLLDHSDMGLGCDIPSHDPMDFIPNYSSSTLAPIPGPCFVSEAPFTTVHEGAIMGLDINLNLGTANHDAGSWAGMNVEGMNMDGLDEGLDFDWEGLGEVDLDKETE